MSSVTLFRAELLLVFAAVLMFADVSQALAASAQSEIEVARGIELVNAGRFQEAVASLERALAADPTSLEALYYGGLAHSRLGEYAAANELLERALEIEETAEICFELGRVRALTGRCADAQIFLASYERLGSDEPGRKAAEGLLRGCGGVKSASRLRLSISLGDQYDSNVILEPQQPTAPKPSKDDWRALLYVSAGATALKTRTLTLDLGYSFYGSLHERFHDYDTIANRLNALLALPAWGRARLSLGYVFDYSYFDGNAYNRTHRGSLQVAVREGERAAAEAVFEVRGARFWNSELFTDNADRTGAGESVGLRQRWGSGPVEVSLALFGDRDRAREDCWAVDGWRASAKALWRSSETIAIGLSGEYQARDYDAPYPGQQASRADRTQTWAATISWSLTPALSLTLSESWSHNDSNLTFYEYTRNIVGLYATIGLGR